MDDWEMSGPQEGDVTEQRVFVCNVNPDGPYEVIELCHGSVAKKKEAASKIVELLNRYHAKLSTTK